MNNLDWNLVRAFHATAEAGSLSAAARQLGLTQPTLSRQIAALEAALGATLFDRIGKRLTLTMTGLGLIDHARAMGEAADTLALAAAGRAEEIGGVVRISASDAFAAYLLPGIVARIRRLVPQVALTIIASNALSDLRRREADIAIRHVRPTEPELIGRLVCEMEARFYASRDWITRHGAPTSRATITGSDLLGGDPPDRYSAYLRDIGMDIPPDSYRIVSESSVVLWEMVRKGLGIGIMVREIAEATEGVVEIRPEAPAIAVPVWLVTHREMRTSRRIKAVFDALAEEIAACASGKGPGSGSRL
jgi:DNA-binding transcriptional LysR family regulator